MFKGLINDAKAAAASFVDTYLARASVAVPFVIAFGFATAAVGLALTERFGAPSAFFMMAAGFCAIGFVAAIVVTLKEQETAAAEEQQRDQTALGEMATAATQAAEQLPLGMLVSLLGMIPSGSALGGERLLRRHLPLVLLLGFLALLLLWRGEESEAHADVGEHPPVEGEPGAQGTAPEADSASWLRCPSAS